MKVLLITAMPSESKEVLTHFNLKPSGKFANFFPYFSVSRNNSELLLLQTYVGSIHAPAATALALQQIKPDIVIKVGCVGANTAGVKTNDIIVPLSFFHSGAWVTSSYLNHAPTSDASVWQSLFGDKPYQNNKENLGGLNYTFSPDKHITNIYKETLNNERIQYIEAHLGSGDMVISDKKVMEHIEKDILNSHKNNSKWCTDNESYAIAQVCEIFKIPFTGVYFVASSDYESVNGYDPDNIHTQTKETILSVLEELLKKIER